MAVFHNNNNLKKMKKFFFVYFIATIAQSVTLSCNDDSSSQPQLFSSIDAEDVEAPAESKASGEETKAGKDQSNSAEDENQEEEEEDDSDVRYVINEKKAKEWWKKWLTN